jgi:integrase
MVNRSGHNKVVFRNALDLEDLLEARRCVRQGSQLFHWIPTGSSARGVRRTVIDTGEGLTYDTTKTRGSDRRVPLMPHTAQLLADYLADHPRASDPIAPLFCAMTLRPVRPTGKSAVAPNDSGGDTSDGRKPLTASQKADRQAQALADLSVAEATERLVLDWSQPLRHQTFYKSVFRPAVLRANRLAGCEVLPTKFKFHGLRHTYASLCAAAGIDVGEVSANLGHSKVTTTQDIYTHLFRTDDSASASMTKLAALAVPTVPNVVPIRRRG